jgi:hypothetical protein
MNPILYWSLLILTCAFAFGRGERYERMAALVCLGGSALTLIIHLTSSVTYVDVEQGDLAIDLAVLAAFIAIALVSDRFWPLWVAGLQLTTSTAHLLKAVEIDLLPQAYAAAARFWSYPILIIVAVGAWRAHKRRLAQERQGTA